MELCLEVFEDGVVIALAYDDDGILDQERVLYRGQINRPLHLALVGSMASEYEGYITDWVQDFYIDHGEIDDDLWDEVWTYLEKVED